MVAMTAVTVVAGVLVGLVLGMLCVIHDRLSRYPTGVYSGGVPAGSVRDHSAGEGDSDGDSEAGSDGAGDSGLSEFSPPAAVQVVVA